MDMEHPDACIQCGTCVAVCPVEMVGGHAIVTFLANPEATDYSVWLCTSCWRCHQACPTGVDIYGLMMEGRRAGQEPVPGGYQGAFERVLASGLALEVLQQALDQVRAAWDLERVALPPSGLARALLGSDE
jgi:heterodisulfide reductase subunit C